MPVTIRHEQKSDIRAIRELTVAAFTDSELGYHGEAEIIDRLRANCPEFLSLVAEDKGQIIGHILFSPVQIVGEGRVWSGLGLAPMCVRPESQNQGIGSLLVETGLKQLAGNACPFVVVLGHPEFYARFGFEAACQYGITCEFAGIPDDVFRIKRMPPDRRDRPQGTAKYRREFSVDDSTLTEPDDRSAT